ncbi:MAG: hypothetical protein MZV65_25040 [Chromatiales bacterium]|nr:hypothetical protein [Chromatiales bacterium]
MAAIDAQVSTGLAGLDRVFRGVMAGDNIVWQVDTRRRLRAAGRAVLPATPATRGCKLVYFHFARHHPLLHEGPGSKCRCWIPATDSSLS